MYASVSDVVARFDQQELAKMTGGSTVDTTIVADLLTAVTSVVDAALRKGGYALPLTTVPPAIKDVTCYLTIKRIYARKISVTEIPEGLKGMFEWAERFLEDLANGDVDLGVPRGMNAGAVHVKHGMRPDVLTATDKEYTEL